MWIFYGLMSAFFAALVAIFGKLGLKNIDSTLATTLRSIVMAVFLISISLMMNKFHGFSADGLTKKEILLIVAAGLAGGISWLFYFVALKNGPTTAVAGLDRLSLPIIFILSIFFLSEKVTMKSVFGVFLMIVGSILLII